MTSEMGVRVADIFVSYARPDRDRVRGLADSLSSLGWTVWWDREILAGKDFDDVIQGQLDSARCVLVVWSAASITSRWVKTEASEGMKRGILIPVILDGVAPPLAFRNLQTVSLDDSAPEDQSPAFQDLVRSIEALVGGRPGGRIKPGPAIHHAPDGTVRDHSLTKPHPLGPVPPSGRRFRASHFGGATAILLTLVVAGYLLFTGSGRLRSGGIGAAMVSGEPFVVVFDSLPEHIGTIKPQGRYDVAFLPAQQAWRASGPMYPQGEQMHTDPASMICDPKTGALCIWGAAFRFDESGQVFYIAGADAATSERLRDRVVGRIVR